jgi:signal transduction histidine kinase
MRDLDYFLRISNHLAGELDIRAALRAVKGEIDKIIELDHLDVCLIDDDGNCNTSYEVGIRTSWSMTKSPIGASPVRDILTGRTDNMLTGDAMVDPRYTFPGSISDPIRKHKLCSRVNVAMKVLGKTVGALNCSSKRKDFYTHADVARAQNLADILAPYFFALRANEGARKEAVERARIASQQEGLRLGALRLTEALEQERQRIGMDLHDQTLADLTRLSRDLRPRMSVEETANLQDRFQFSIQQLRNIIETSVPSILELFGFEEAVRAHFESVRRPEQDIVLRYVDATYGTFLSTLVETERIALFRICQEAINNSVCHANPKCLQVLLSKISEDRFNLTIKDDGVFKATTRVRKGGLLHMKTRAKLIGASLKIDASAGTTITVSISPRLELGK